MKALLHLVLSVSSFSADQSSARSLGHRFLSSKKSLKSLAFLLFWHSGFRQESGKHLQGMVWKSLSRQGSWSLLYNVDMGAPGLELWEEANTGKDGHYFMAFTMEWARRRTLDIA